jgi:type I restriction enzyme M protein
MVIEADATAFLGCPTTPVALTGCLEGSCGAALVLHLAQATATLEAGPKLLASAPSPIMLRLMTDWHSEEDVKIHFLLPFLEERGYKRDCVRFDVGIEVQEGRKRTTIFADAVVYASPKSKAPLVLCETKAPGEILDRKVRDQAISYARLLPRIVPLALTTNGAQVQVFQTLNKNRIKELPRRKELQADIVNFVISKDLQEALRQEARHELFIIDDVQVFKRVLRSCHNEIRNNEGYDPVAAFDEMSKVLFCKLYEEKTNPERNRFRLTVFDETLEDLNINVVAQIFEETKKAENYAGLFSPESAIALSDQTIRRIVELFESYDLSLTAFDVKGEAFEYFLSDTFTGGLGEYFTPRNVVEFMVDAIDPKIGETIIDPFCGTGGFLIFAFDVVGSKIRVQDFSDAEKERWRVELSNRSLSGTDWKERTSQACKMNMMVHGDGSAGIFKAHGLLDVPGRITESQFDICLTNPPFGAYEKDKSVLNRFELGTGRQSQDRMVLAIERTLNLLKPGGRMAIVVAEGLLDNSSHKYVRDFIRAHARVLGVIALPKATFEGYGAKAKTSILLLEKKESPDDGEQDSVFFAIVENSGYAPNGAAVAGNELPDALLAWQAYRQGELIPTANAWVSELSDRLDAKFYRTHSSVPTADIDALSDDLNERIAHSRTLYRTYASDVAKAFADVEFDDVVLSELLEEVSDREAVADESDYRLVGVHWWGRGTFIREEKKGRDIKGKSLYRISEGWLIYNRLFAFRGSFAVVPDLHTGCYVSSEFPTYIAKPDVEDPALVIDYVVHALNSPQYLELVEARSTGSTKESRNRFAQALFESFTIKMPRDVDHLTEVVKVLTRANELRDEQMELLDLAKELREGVSLLIPRP